MKFKILSIEQKGNNLQVVVSHKNCQRQVFSFPIELAKENKYIEEIQRILFERENSKKEKIDKTVIGKEIEIDEKETEKITEKKLKIKN